MGKKKGGSSSYQPKDEEILASIAHVALATIGSHALLQMEEINLTNPFMHFNFVINGIVGFIYYQKKTISGQTLHRSCLAAKYLALPALLADIHYEGQKYYRAAFHVLSGIIPFGLSLYHGQEPSFGLLLLNLNIISLAHFAWTRANIWAWGVCAAAVLGFYIAPDINNVKCPYLFSYKSLIPTCMALIDYFAYHMNKNRPSEVPAPVDTRIPGRTVATQVTTAKLKK